MRKSAVVVCFLLITVLISRGDSASDAAKFWPQWRGPAMNGVAPTADPPVEWSETRNVRWKAEIPGKGSSSPIVWGDKVFVLTAVPSEKQPAKSDAPPSTPPRAQGARGPRGNPPTQVLKFTILAISRKDGKILWQRALREELPHEGTHPTGSWASSSAMTDGEYVYAYFGSRGLYCLDMKGNLKWEKDLGKMTIKMGFGEGASPVLYRDRIIVNWDHEGPSFIAALDKKTGKELWRTTRDEKTAWATPLVVEHDGKAQVITSASGKVRSYDVATGALVWETTGMTANTIPSPVAADGIVYLTSGFRGNALLAIRLAAAKGDISASAEALAWKYDRDTPYVPSPLLYGDALYILKSNSGVLTCFNAKTGEKYFGEQRLESVPNVYASPVGAGNRVYITGREGTVVVLERARQFKMLATNKLEDGFDASPAVVDKEIYLRGQKYLYRISKD